MSPKKTANNATSKRKITEKLPKRTVKREKPKLNMPANLKVSIPHTPKCIEDGIYNPVVHRGRPPKFKKASLLDFNTKVDLANSVARQQLVKDEIATQQMLRDEIARQQMVKDEISQIEQKNNIKVRKRGKKTTVISDFFKVMENNCTDFAPTPTFKKQNKKATAVKPEPTKRIVTRKRLADSVAEEAAKRLKLEPRTDTESVIDNIKLVENYVSDSFVDSDPVIQPLPVVPVPQPTPLAAKKSPVVEQPTPLVVQKSPFVVQPTPLVVQKSSGVVQPSPILVKTKPTVKKTESTMKQPQRRVGKPNPPTARKKRGPKGKKEILATGDQSPSILDRLEKWSKKETEGEAKIQQTTIDIPRPVDSRKTSVSSNSNLSWTKDISSSSTTTCVTVSSNDFIRFNKKLPILKLTHVDNEVNKRKNAEKTADVTADEADDDSSDSSDSDSTDSERKFSERLTDSLDVNSLHLSASSQPSSHLSQTGSKNSSLNYAKAAEKLTLTIKKFDMEIINWFSSDIENEDVDANLAKFKDKMFEILDIEFGVITHCRRLKEILDPPRYEDMIDETCLTKPSKDNNDVNVKKNVPAEDNNGNNFKENAPVEDEANDHVDNAQVVKTSEKVEFVKPLPCRKLSSVSESNATIASDTAEDNSGEENPAGKTRDYPYYDHHDDDDALSLFAESITGFESSRVNTTIASVPVHNTRPVEEYVPKPVKIDFSSKTEKHTYCPTKLREGGEIASKVQTICEKQNADSTSINKQSISTDDADSYQDFTENVDLYSRLGAPETMKPFLMKHLVEVSPKMKSHVFNNFCFYNLMNTCRMSVNCRYLHRTPSSAEIQNKLKLLDDRTFIQEYIILRKWHELRRRYVMCFVEECWKRRLTRILVEMAFDLIMLSKKGTEADTTIRVQTIEATLLHLNNVDLSSCEDLLMMSIHEEPRTLLCDVFMATMSITQNFSRFKKVFLNLTYIMVDKDRTFNKDVVEHILERVCILPFEEPMTRALIEMMRLTSSEIMNNSMIGHFEKQISANKDVFEEYSLLKNQLTFTSMMKSSVVAPSPPPQGPSPPAPSGRSTDGQPTPEPDTTNLDTLNKTAEEPPQPVITRTIGMNPPIIFQRSQLKSGALAQESPGPSQPSNNSSSSNEDSANQSVRKWRNNSSSSNKNSANQSVGKWRNRSIFPHQRPPSMSNRPLMSAPTRFHPRFPMNSRPPIRGQMRPPVRLPFNQRLVTFRGPNNYMNRPPGPKY